MKLHGNGLRVLATGIAYPEGNSGDPLRWGNAPLMHDLDLRYPAGGKKAGQPLPDDWATQKFGIVTRAIDYKMENGRLVKRPAHEGGKFGVELAEIAIQRACDDADLGMSRVDAIIRMTATPEDAGVANWKRVLHTSPGFDGKVYGEEHGCGGFFKALELADMLIASGRMKNVAIVCDNNPSAMLATPELRYPYKFELDRFACVLNFSDGAAAVIVTAATGASDETRFEEVVTMHECGDPKSDTLIRVDAGGAWGPPCPSIIGSSGYVMLTQNVGRKFMVLIPKMIEGIDASMRELGLSKADVVQWASHQASAPSIVRAFEKAEIDVSFVPMPVKEDGNLAAAAMPNVIHRILSGGDVPSGSYVGCVGIGAGEGGSYAGRALLYVG